MQATLIPFVITSPCFLRKTQQNRNHRLQYCAFQVLMAVQGNMYVSGATKHNFGFSGVERVTSQAQCLLPTQVRYATSPCCHLNLERRVGSVYFFVCVYILLSFLTQPFIAFALFCRLQGSPLS